MVLADTPYHSELEGAVGVMRRPIDLVDERRALVRAGGGSTVATGAVGLEYSLTSHQIAHRSRPHR